jgi:uncharacterized protein YbjT (DUF2867 family)
MASSRICFACGDSFAAPANLVPPLARFFRDVQALLFPPMSEPSPEPASAVELQRAIASVRVVGASGLVGGNVLRLLAGTGVRVEAATRAVSPPVALAALAAWQCGAAADLRDDAVEWRSADALIGAGPLDLLANRLMRNFPKGLKRLIALSSTSAVTKANASDQVERELAKRLLEGEESLVETCEKAGVAWTILRPTLIWGEGRDRNVSALAEWMRRRRILPLPGFATGRRQPIRAIDVARALVTALSRPASVGQCIDVPGGEILRYDEMVRRIADVLSPPGRIVRVPGMLVTTIARIARTTGIAPAGLPGVIDRLREDLVFSGDPAHVLLGVAPEGFRPTPEDFPVT